MPGLSIGAHVITFSSIPGYVTAASEIVTVTDSETTLSIGNYTQIESTSYTLTVNTAPASEGMASAGGSVFPAGSLQTVTAVPNSGYEFVAWVGQGTGTSNPLTVYMYTNLSVTAYFAPTNSMTLTVITNGLGTVSPSWSNKTLIKGRTYGLSAVARSDNLFSNWTGSLTTNKSPLPVRMESSVVSQANFVPNPFIPNKGTYNGLFMTTSGVTETNAGMLSGLTVNQNGNYSGALLINGGRHGISGKFNLSGQATNKISRPAGQGGPLVANLTLAWSSSPPQVVGTVSNANWVANIMADRGANALRSEELTMLIPPDTNNAPPVGSPGGYGYAAITNYAATLRNPGAAIARISGTLADGTHFSQATPVSQDGYLPLYANLYGGKGLLLGWINLTVTNESGVGLAWIHPAILSGKGLYTAGFTNVLQTTQIMLSPWSNAPSSLALLTNLSLLDTATNTNVLASYPVSISSTGRVTNSGLRGSVNLRTGVFQITINPGRTAIVANGAILLDTNVGGGYYLTSTNAQAVYLGN